MNMGIFKSHLDGNLIMNFEAQEKFIDFLFGQEIIKEKIDEPFSMVQLDGLLSHIYNSCIHCLEQPIKDNLV